MPRSHPRTLPPNLLAQANAALPSLLAQLRSLVEAESPTDAPAAVNQAADLVTTFAEPLGGRPRRHSRPGFGDVLELRFGPARSPRKPILLLGHLDTVWPLGTLRNMPFRQTRKEVAGPGVLDMKAGVLMALHAVDLARQNGLSRPVTLLLNPDEEVGSPVSRPLTERLALRSAAVLVLEPAQGLACKTARKGIANYTLAVTGRAAHSGVDFPSGHSAILELAHQIHAIAALTDLPRGLTLNPGVITGGTRSNVVAAHATAEIDVRLPRAADAARIDRALRRLKPHDPACTLSLSGGLNRPPMERSPAVVRLYRHAAELAAGLGFHLPEASTGGASDGNLTAALGIPTLDGLGAVGAGAHAPHEHLLPEHLAPRTALLAALLLSLR